jgi:hypothetical protein
MADDYWTRKVRQMPLSTRQSRYRELTKKVAGEIVLSKDELAELIALREVLQNPPLGGDGDKDPDRG